MAKILIADLAKEVAKKHKLPQKETEQFIANMFAVVAEGLQQDKLVKVKGLGTFKVTQVKPRESVDVNTGERVLISGHDKVTFTPDSLMKELVNKPFAQFETVVINGDVDFAAIDAANPTVETEDVTVETEPADDAAVADELANEPEEVQAEPKEMTAEPEEVTAEPEEIAAEPEEPSEGQDLLDLRPGKLFGIAVIVMIQTGHVYPPGAVNALVQSHLFPGDGVFALFPRFRHLVHEPHGADVFMLRAVGKQFFFIDTVDNKEKTGRLRLAVVIFPHFKRRAGVTGYIRVSGAVHNDPGLDGPQTAFAGEHRGGAEPAGEYLPECERTQHLRPAALFECHRAHAGYLAELAFCAPHADRQHRAFLLAGTGAGREG